MIVLEVNNASAGYQHKPVIKSADFFLQKGEVVALLGPNGIGKTTLIRMVTGSLSPLKGTVLLNGKELKSMSARSVARTIARVVQSPQLAWSFSVRHVVSLGRWPHRNRFGMPEEHDEKVIEQAMKSMEIDDLADRDFSTLSGGEAQRTLVAQALAQEPSILVMDEPVAHLDLHHQISTLDLIRQFACHGITVFISLHDINLAALYADRIAIIDREGAVHIGDRSDMLNAGMLEKLFKVKLSSASTCDGESELLYPVPGSY